MCKNKNVLNSILIFIFYKYKFIVKYFLLVKK